jgi:protease-4
MMRILFRIHALAACVLIAAVCTGCATGVLGILERPDVRAIVVEEGSGWARPTIVIVDVSGVLTAGPRARGLFGQDSSVVELADKLAAARRLGRVEALILRIDSPGGGVTASDLMYREVLRYREETGVPVHAAMQSVCASGGYYVAMAADHVSIVPTGITGSIGVIALFPSASRLLDRVGLEVNAVTSGGMKDAGAPYRPFSALDRQYYQQIVDDLYSRFAQVVRRNRPEHAEAELVNAETRARVYTANAALEAGLVDRIEYLDETIARLRAEVGKGARVVLLERANDERVDSYYARAGSAGGDVNLVKFQADASALTPSGTEAFHYLWVP